MNEEDYELFLGSQLTAGALALTMSFYGEAGTSKVTKVRGPSFQRWVEIVGKDAVVGGIMDCNVLQFRKNGSAKGGILTLKKRDEDGTTMVDRNRDIRQTVTHMITAIAKDAGVRRVTVRRKFADIFQGMVLAASKYVTEDNKAVLYKAIMDSGSFRPHRKDDYRNSLSTYIYHTALDGPGVGNPTLAHWCRVIAMDISS